MLSEAFDIGYEVAMDSNKPADATLPPDPYGLYGENQWPDEETMAGFSESYIRF